MAKARFIGQPIEVETAGVPRRPVAFVWDKKRYAVTEVVSERHDWGFHPADPMRKWTTRRHRNHFRVLTDDGSTFDLYLDRATPKGPQWFLAREVLSGRPVEERPRETRRGRNRGRPKT